MSDLNFAIVEASGLTQKEFGNLCGVSRITANAWINGHSRPNRWLVERATEVLGQLHRAVEARRMPVAVQPGDSQRAKLVLAALYADHDAAAEEATHAD